MLARLWRKTEGRLSVPSTVAPKSGPVLVSTTVAPTMVLGTGLPPEPLSEAPKRVPKRARIGRLYLERKPKPLIHARALVKCIQEQCPELIGTYVPDQDLEKAYVELCAKEGWEPCGWIAIARQLKGMKVEKRTIKRNGERFRAAYRIPKVRSHPNGRGEG